MRPPKIQIDGETYAFLSEGWSGPNPDSVHALDEATETVSYPTADPHPALTIAKALAKQFGGIVSDEGEPDEYDPDLVY